MSEGTRVGPLNNCERSVLDHAQSEAKAALHRAVVLVLADRGAKWPDGVPVRPVIENGEMFLEFGPA